MDVKGIKLGEIIHMIPRGLRNNNPGNIRYLENQDWYGQDGHDADKFCMFQNTYYGLRAMYLILHTYITKHKRHSVQSIIDMYDVSPSKNHNKYAAYVSSVTGFYRYSPQLTVESIPKLMHAMVGFELGMFVFRYDFVEWVCESVQKEQSLRVEEV